ncbi:MAG: EAL domain-containing protein [Candidatus Nanopelagicales bacterium]
MDRLASALLQGVDVALQVSAPTGEVLATSAAWRVLLGARAPSTGDGWLLVLAEHDRDRLSRVLLDDTEGRRATRAQVRLVDAQGQPRWCSVSRTPMVVDDDLVGWVTQLQPTQDADPDGEVTWRERDILRAAERIGRMGAWDWHIDTGHLWWSDEVYRIFGLEPQEFPATYQGFLERVHPDDRAELERRVAAAVEGVEDYDVRHRVVRPDGSIRYMRERGAVTRLPDGTAVRMLGTVLDVTDETLAEFVREEAVSALADSEARNRLLVENSSDFVGLSDADGVVEWISDSVTRVLGWTPEELIGRPAWDLLHPDDVARAAADRPRFESGEAFETRYRLRCKDGSYRWISRMTRGVDDAEGRMVQHVSGFRDVTSQIEAEVAAAAGRTRLRAAMDAMLDPHVLLEAIRDEDGQIVDFLHVDANRAADAHTRALGDTLVGKRLLAATPGQEAAGMVDMYARVVETGEPLVLDAFPYADEAAGGEVRLFDMRGVKVGDAISLTFRDVTDRVAAERRIAESEARYRLLAENASDVVWLRGGDGLISWVSESVRRVLGWEPDDLIGRGDDLVHPDDRVRAGLDAERRVAGQSTAGQYRIATGDGGWRWMSVVSRSVPADAGRGRVVALRDVQDEVATRTELEHVLGHDPLTGLAGREVVVVRLREQLEALRARPRSSLAVLSVAIDALGDVVSGLGHSAGDLVIAAVVTRMVVAVGDPDRVGRGSGNEFFVLIPEPATSLQAAAVAEALHRGVRGPVAVGGQVVDPTVSVGIALASSTDDAERLLRDATLALRKAKASGRDQTVYADPDLAVAARERLAVESGIREGLRGHEFVPWFQPIVDLLTREVSGYEALARWTRSDDTVLLPRDFMDVAEATGLVRDLDLAILDQAAVTLADLPVPLSVSVNVSAATLAQPGFDKQVLERLADRGADPARLHLEVTETTLLTMNAAVTESIHALADAGIRWYVDDFGTGYSSVSHLRDLPIGGLKLDRSFTLDAPTGHRSRQLAGALAALSASLDIDTVAEGVETRQQANILLGQGWRKAQGWLFGRPAPSPEQSAPGAGAPADP